MNHFSPWLTYGMLCSLLAHEPYEYNQRMLADYMAADAQDESHKRNSNTPAMQFYMGELEMDNHLARVTNRKKNRNAKARNI